jgi:HK97 family phage major capsid protein
MIDKDVNKVLMALGANKKETEAVTATEKNANEVMHTDNTGFGKELVPVDVLQQEIISLIPQYSTFLGSLPGYHGTNMAVSEKVPVKGEVGFFHPNTEPTTGALGPVGEGTHRLATDEVTVTQGQFIAKVALSKRILNYAIGDLETYVKEALAKSAARTQEALILNADSTAGMTGNVNLNDSTPDATSYYLEQDNGLRKIAIADTANLTVDVAALDLGDFLKMMNIVGDLPIEQCAWIMPRNVYTKGLGLEHFYKANERGQSSTVSGKAITNIFGADLFIARDMPSGAVSTGNVETTGNTTGQF